MFHVFHGFPACFLFCSLSNISANEIFILFIFICTYIDLKTSQISKFSVKNVDNSPNSVHKS